MKSYLLLIVVLMNKLSTAYIGIDEELFTTDIDIDKEVIYC